MKGSLSTRCPIRALVLEGFQIKRLLKQLKSVYVTSIHALGRVLARLGGLARLEKRSDARWAHWLRSLFAIYDIDQLVALDVPWWTYRAIDRVDGFLGSRRGAKVFEYGSGASTVWLAKRAASVISIEHDADWYPIVEERAAGLGNVDLRLITTDQIPARDPVYLSLKEGQVGHSFRAYAEAIDATGEQFDLIVIDGRVRAACLRHARSHLAKGGLIVFDNSRRDRYDQAIKSSGMKESAYPGLTPSLPYPDKTTLLQEP